MESIHYISTQPAAIILLSDILYPIRFLFPKRACRLHVPSQDLISPRNYWPRINDQARKKKHTNCFLFLSSLSKLLSTARMHGIVFEVSGQEGTIGWDFRVIFRSDLVVKQFKYDSGTNQFNYFVKSD